ncbi:hypothetical protein BH24ACI3_BH24ACI3_07650 [soil metagenome]
MNELILTKNTPTEQPEIFETGIDRNNVYSFSTTLSDLRKELDPNMLRHRDGVRDRQGNVRAIEYVEWHTVADILDETAPNWHYSIKDIRAMGDTAIVTVAITIDGVTREGIGTGTARSEAGIKKAEHDALKHAAVKFGIARELYKRDEVAFETKAPIQPAVTDPVAKSIGDLITTKQMGMIRAVARERNLDAEAECREMMKCRINELSRKAASALIDHLQTTPAEMALKQAS